MMFLIHKERKYEEILVGSIVFFGYFGGFCG